jgi:hypothetical protein
MGFGTVQLRLHSTSADKKPIGDATLTITAVMNQHGMLGVPSVLTDHSLMVRIPAVCARPRYGRKKMAIAALHVVQGECTMTLLLFLLL